MEKHILSKSTFVKGHQCEKALYLHKYKPELKTPIDEQTMQIMKRGTDVGVLAQQLYPNGIDASPDTPYQYQESVALTQQYLEAGHKVIYEACFQYNGVLCALDILVNIKGKWYAFEVKSSAEVKDYHYTDTALQYYVITKSGLALEDISIIHLNNKYTRKGALNIKELFSTKSVLKQALEMQKEVEEKIKILKDVLKNKNKEPNIEVSSHCFSPFSCEFQNYCWDKLNIEPIIWDLYKTDFEFCIKNKIYKLDKIPATHKLHGRSKTKLNKLQATDITINKEKIKEFLAQLKAPFYYFDFETYQMAVPEFDFARPYQMITFQYSLHVSNKNELTHSEFLGDGISDPRIPLIQKMITELGKKGSIICYNSSFEKTRLKELALQFPKYETYINNIINRIEDLMIPFQKLWYYHPDFKASYSIKYVLDTLIPKFSYQNLNIKNGGEASSIYPTLSLMDSKTKKQTINDLLEYCKLDTLAMVKIHQYLQQLILEK